MFEIPTYQMKRREKKGGKYTKSPYNIAYPVSKKT
jgi:hypothetical protein